MDWTEMSEMSSPNSGKHPSYKRTGSKDSMEVIFLIEKGNFEFCRSFFFESSNCSSSHLYCKTTIDERQTNHKSYYGC